MYNRENMLLNVALAGLLVLSGAAFAQGMLGDAGSATPDLAKVDTDADGFVTLNEAKQVKGLPEAFGQADKNADGKLDASEFEAAVKAMQSSGS
ncbi:MAG: hypothetical protein HYX62_09670 [Gammaproteobacteria bacterium]|jgi:hypothetical protein|nr:hypothetical protein [Gammaproteobacteria bacterium]